MTQDDINEILCVALVATYKKRGYFLSIGEQSRNPTPLVARKVERNRTMMNEWQKRLDGLMIRFADELVLPDGRFDKVESDMFVKAKHDVSEYNKKHNAR